jgi:raffinose/stachyose/melibiose transport system substrate-binding protein
MEQERVPTVPNLALVKENTIHADVAAAWSAVNENDGVGHYQDWASPTMFDTDIAAIQEMLAHAITPEEFVQKIEKDYAAYLAEKGQ